MVEPNLSTQGIAVLADSLELNGGGIASASGSVAAELSHGGLDHDPNHKVDWTQASNTNWTDEGRSNGALYAAVSRWVSEVGAGIRSLWDAVARLPASFQENRETAGASSSPPPGSAAVWHRWPY